MDSKFFDEADISVEKSFDSVFSEEKVDDFFYKAFKKDHSGKSMEATIEDELNDLSLYREMNNFTKINNILRISGEEDYQERMVGISSRYYNKALVKIKEQIARYADLKNNVTHYLPPSNSASKAERKNYERDAQELAQEVEEQIQFTEDMRSVYANNIIKFAMIDAEVIAKVVGHSRTTLKDLDSYKQILKHYEELKTVDIETAFKQENIDSSLTILARMNESMLNFKYDMAEMWHNPDLKENIKLVKSDIAHYQKDKIREYSANVQNQYGVLSQKYSKDKKVDILFENSLASSVLPTPVVPKNKKLPIGRLGSLIPILLRLIAFATAFMASSCPFTLLDKISSNLSNFSASPSFNLVTGILVHLLTTSAISFSVISVISFAEEFSGSFLISSICFL